MAGYSLGATSLSHLKGVHPLIAKVVHRAIETTEQDFSVYDGLRTIEEQREYVRTGASKSMESKHLPQLDGFGHAVDLAPFINGKIRWEWGPIYVVAKAMISASIELSVNLNWGAIWDRRTRDLPIDVDGLRRAVQAYRDRHPGDDFIDGPHWQLV